jgi:hypothetical protein
MHAAIKKIFIFSLSCWQRQIKTNAVRPRQWRNAALFGRLVALLPASGDFFDFFARDRMTVGIVAAFVRIPRMTLCQGGADKHRGGNHLYSH